MQPKTMLVKPWGEGQGDHVVINEEDFNPDFHKRLDEVEKPEDLTATQIKEQLKAKGIEFRGNASKAELQALLDASNKPEGT